MSKIYLVRHGEIENPNETLYGNLPGYHLSEEGKDQILRVASWLKANVTKPCKLIASPLERAQETAGMIAEALGLQVMIDPRLTEWGMGEWIGKPIEAFYRHSGYYSPDFKTDGMETLDQMANRMFEAVRDAMQDCGEDPLIVCSHREPMASLLIKLQNKSWPEIHRVDMPKGSIWELVFDELEFINAERISIN